MPVRAFQAYLQQVLGLRPVLAAQRHRRAEQAGRSRLHEALKVKPRLPIGLHTLTNVAPSYDVETEAAPINHQRYKRRVGPGTRSPARLVADPGRSAGQPDIDHNQLQALVTWSHAR